MKITGINSIYLTIHVFLKKSADDFGIIVKQVKINGNEHK